MPITKEAHIIFDEYSEAKKLQIIIELEEYQKTHLFGTDSIFFIDKLRYAGYPSSVSNRIAINTVKDYCVKYYIEQKGK